VARTGRIEWERACRVDPSRPSILIVDGFESVVGHPTPDSPNPYPHLLQTYDKHLSTVVPNGHVRAFSYRGLELGYTKRDSRLVRGAALKFGMFLPSGKSACVVPIGASGGAIVTLLGLRHWIRELKVPPQYLQLWVPMTILVSPPFNLNEDFFRLAFRVPNDRQALKRYPAEVAALVESDSEEGYGLLHDVVEALGLLRWAWYPASNGFNGKGMQ
jgi:hypothetical protein